MRPCAMYILDMSDTENTNRTEDSMDTIETTLFALAAEYGVDLTCGPYQTDTDTDITIHRDDDGWHVTADDGRYLADMDWAPNDDWQAGYIRAELA